jgi:hypothetical protein
MPWHKKAMKDAGTCDKPRQVGNKRYSRGSPNEETPPVYRRMDVL